MTNWSLRCLFLVALIFLAVLLGIWSKASSYLAWKRTLREAGFVDEMSPPGSSDRILVVAPHPDDEMLGCGGLIQQALAEGAQVEVALMTNGDGSQLAVIFGERELPRSPQSFLDLGSKRQEESLRALSAIGLNAHHIHFLGFPNNGLLKMWRPEYWDYTHLYRSPYTKASYSPYPNNFTPKAPYCGTQVLADLITLLQEVRPTMVFVTNPQDIHPDHWATYCFVRYALATLANRGNDWVAETKVFGYLIHWPRYPAPRHRALKLDLLPPPELVSPDREWLNLPLTPIQTRAKDNAIKCYRTQEPGFDRLLQALARKSEAFELLTIKEITPGGSLIWNDQENGRRGFGGTKVKQLQMSIPNHQLMQVDLSCTPRPIPRAGYICLDIRTWDQNHNPVISAVYLGAAGKITTKQFGKPDGENVFKPEVQRSHPGEFQINIGGTSREKDLFITCWGSVNDRLTDPAVASWIHLTE